MPYECPLCSEEIDHLLYKEDATVYGTYDIETEDYEREDVDTDGGLRFTCPECDGDIDSIDDLIDTEARERERENQEERQNNGWIPAILANESRPSPAEEERRELPIPPAIDQNWRGEYSGYHNSHDRQKQSAILICPHCGSKNEAIENETIECYKCGKDLNLQTAKEIIEVEKPNNPGF